MVLESMSKNYFRSQLRRLGKAKEKSRVRSVPTLSPETTPSASPVHTQVESPTFVKRFGAQARLKSSDTRSVALDPGYLLRTAPLKVFL